MEFSGVRLKRLRQKLGLSQVELSRQLFISVRSLSRYECGECPGVEVLRDIAYYFDVDMEYFLGSTRTPAPLVETVDEDILREYIGARLEDNILGDVTYYWIRNVNDEGFDVVTIWAGFDDDGNEIREPREVDPYEVLDYCKVHLIPCMVINDREDIPIAIIFRSDAVVMDKIYKEREEIENGKEEGGEFTWPDSEGQGYRIPRGGSIKSELALWM